MDRSKSRHGIRRNGNGVISQKSQVFSQCPSAFHSGCTTNVGSYFRCDIIGCMLYTGPQYYLIIPNDWRVATAAIRHSKMMDLPCPLRDMHFLETPSAHQANLFGPGFILQMPHVQSIKSKYVGNKLFMSRRGDEISQMPKWQRLALHFQFHVKAHIAL